MFYFSEDGYKLTVRYYSVEKGMYGSESSQFTVDLSDHNHTYKTTGTDATLTKNGKKTYTCTSCGYVKTATVYSPKSIKLSKNTYTYDGKVKNPTVTVKDSKGKKLTKDKDFRVIYETGCKNPGIYTVKVKFIGDYSGSKDLKLTIKPKKVTDISATQTIKSITLKWDASVGADGYRVYKYNSSTKKYEHIKSTSKASYKISDLKGGTKYKFKIRAYKKDTDVLWADYSAVFETATRTKSQTLTVLESHKHSLQHLVFLKDKSEVKTQI